MAEAPGFTLAACVRFASVLLLAAYAFDYIGGSEARGRFVVELNDDALVPTDFLCHIDALFAEHADIGVIGVRAIEDDYARQDGTPGRIDGPTADVIGN